jgi:hypothetical protein
MQPGLIDFVHHARHKGMDHGTIRVLLSSAGWKEKEVAQAFANEGLDLPVPVHAGGSSAREIFVNLLAYTALYTVAISLIVLSFNCLDLLLPDPAWQKWEFSEASIRSAIRWSLASVIIAGPLFFGLARMIASEVHRNPSKTPSSIRKGLTYLTLFVASITLMFDLITLLYYLLEGELSIRILLKAMALCAIVGLVISHCILSMRNLGEAKV